MKKFFKFQFLIFNLLPAIIFFHSCRQQQGSPISISRLEQSLFTIPIDSIPASVPRLDQQYGELLDLYSNMIIRIGSPMDPQYTYELTRFLTDSYMIQAYRRVMEVFPDLKDIEVGLGRAFFNYRNEFPDKAVPSVYTLTSGFNHMMITADTILAISLDMYLGKNEDMYLRLDLPAYQRQGMDRKYLIVDCMKAWINTEFPFDDYNDNVLANILYEGKVIYALRRLLPATPDSLLFGFTPDQMRWCRNNTAQMWTFMVENRMLYSSDYLTIHKLIGPAPFTSLFTRESPGRSVIWLGYRIIASYMKNNKVSLQELLEDDDYQKILSRAKFKP